MSATAVSSSHLPRSSAPLIMHPSSTTTATGSVAAAAAASKNLPPVSAGFRRFVLEAENELRIEANTRMSSATNDSSTSTSKNSAEGTARPSRYASSDNTGGKKGVTVILQLGSCEVFGHELALHRSYCLGTSGQGGLRFPVFTFHGCVIDVGPPGSNTGGDGTGAGVEEGLHDHSDETWWSSAGISAYVATDRDDTAPCLAIVNTHAQLEALRDEALASASSTASTSTSATAASPASTAASSPRLLGPRVLVLGDEGSGVTSVVKTLTSYAVKLGRTPLWVDVDPSDSGVGLPGTLSVAIATRDSLTLSTLLHGGGGWPVGTASPLALFHGSVVPQPDLYKAQVTSLATKVRKRLEATDNDWERSSGLLVNAPSWLALDEHWDVLLHAVQELNISVVLLTGHDKLYAKFKSVQMSSTSTTSRDDESAETGNHTGGIDKRVVIVKLPRSGGVVSRNPHQMRQLRSQSIRRYFYGDDLQESSSSGSGGGGGASAAASKGDSNNAQPIGQPQPSLTPFLAQIKFDQVRLYRCTSMSLASSLLPLGATQTTEKVQLQPVTINEQITHHLLAVCHPHSVASYDESGSAKDLYGAGVAGFVVVERVLVETEMLHLLAPCAGALPSHTFLIGDITWLD